MTKGCPDYINELNDYLDGAIDPELCAEIEAHIGQCNNCRIMVDSMRQTVRLCREGTPEELPEKLSARLNDLLRQRWEKKFGKTK
ncbi:MAG TPA: zf-HC2 domain-containing protein [candidate division Zixibacteria bacterium]|nr:zf-HC2 domain-containing protein [candidate division Zixibacteria bacterium]